VARSPGQGNQRIELAGLLHEISLAPPAEGAGRLETSLEEGLWVRADKALLTLALDALLVLATRCAGPEGVVRIAGRHDAGDSQIRLELSFPAGPLAGLPLERLFEPYALRRSLPELGPNALAAAASIVQGQGGSLFLAPGRGGHLRLALIHPHGRTRTVGAPPARRPVSKSPDMDGRDAATRPLEGARVLLVDEDLEGSSGLVEELARAGFSVETCASLARLERLLESESWDAVLADPETVPIESLALLLASELPPVVLVLAGFGSIHDAVEAMRLGAADYLAKPVEAERLRMALERALEQRSLRQENRRLRADLAERFELGQIESRDPKMRHVFEVVQAVADTRATILLEGESGTGKTLLARSIHRHSSRASAPFVEVNCGAIPANLLESELFGHCRGAFTGAVRDRAGKFEAADRGTIFLDEIACASGDLQVKLLRVLQDRELERVGESRTRKVDVRVIAATNVELEQEVRAGRFREDLFFRLQVVRLCLPPLRERPGDVLLLAQRFLDRLGLEHGRQKRGFDPGCLPILANHDWPGNVRELENGIERAVLLARGEEIRPEDLPWTLKPGGPRPSSGPAPGLGLREALEESERHILLEALRRHGGRRKETAQELGVNRTTLFNKMRKYNLLERAFDD
jgi:DNA-binding NtrC family response regulator